MTAPIRVPYDAANSVCGKMRANAMAHLRSAKFLLDRDIAMLDAASTPRTDLADYARSEGGDYGTTASVTPGENGQEMFVLLSSIRQKLIDAETWIARLDMG